MKRLAMILGLFGCMSAVAVWGMPTAQADGPAKCGDEGLPDCPLQGWMSKNMDAPLDKGDAKALAAAFEKVISMVPDPKWNEGDAGWAKIAQAGADFAKKGDIDNAKKQCKSCHKAWRDKYKANFRMKAVK